MESGPGRVVGAHNGDPALQGPPHAPFVPAYHGLARAVVQVTQASAVALSTHAGDADALALLKVRVLMRRVYDWTGLSPVASYPRLVLQLVNVDAGAAPSSSGIVVIPNGSAPPSIVVTVTSPGLVSASVTLNTSVSWDDSVMATAAANVGNAYVTE